MDPKFMVVRGSQSVRIHPTLVDTFAVTLFLRFVVVSQPLGADISKLSELAPMSG